MKFKQISEQFLHYLWRLKRFDQASLYTTSGDAVHILSCGLHNHDAGPDFLHGKIKIGDTTWAGNIEIHISSSDWDRHYHNTDPAYDNVILHVVFNHDKEIVNNQGNTIPTIVLKDRIDPKLYERYLLFKDNMDWIPCAQHIPQVDPVHISMYLQQVLVQRLSDKVERIEGLYKQTDKDWNRLFYVLIARYLVGKTNADAAEMLMMSIPYSIFLKNQDSAITIEAILFGQADMLSDTKDHYSAKLYKEYQYYKHKYGLKSIAMPWKYMRMRPSSFPSVRIAQLASLIHKSSVSFSNVIKCNDYKSWFHLLRVDASEYWDTHYQIGKESPKKLKTIGSTSIDSLLINVVAPLCFMYGKTVKEDRYVDQALHILSSIKAESNSIIEKWNDHGVISKNAADTQALIHLKSHYCDHSKCLQCSIGHQILKG